MNQKLLVPLLALGLGLLSFSTATAQDGLNVGDKAPDFEIESLGDETIRLSERFGEKGHPTVLVFSRANW